MSDTLNIHDLLQRLEALSTQQDTFSKEINILREQIINLKASQTIPETTFELSQTGSIVDPGISNIPPIPISSQESISIQPENYLASQVAIAPKPKSDIEKFIGENLINKIGIAITVIGVGIGAKYSIEHDLISPLTRIILGYLVGFTLLGVGIRLKKNYKNFSAVLVSGAIAIMYLITFAAYSFYGLMPQAVAFGLMVMFTAGTVYTAIQYNSQVIAIIGLVGAYAVPFLLSEGSGRAGILFAYTAIINLGILFIAIRKYWKTLYYSSFLMTWTIFLLWFFLKYDADLHFMLSLTFVTIFFFTFYFIFLAYKLIRKEKFVFGDILFLLTNSFIFYGVGYSMLNDSVANSQLLGLFTLVNAVIHFMISVLIYRQKLADQNLFYLESGLVLIFITLAIPVQLDGHWVTLLWIGEAAVLFWIGRTRSVPTYERLSYPLIFLAVCGLIYDWMVVYPVNTNQTYITTYTPFLNISFLSSILFAAALFFVNNTNQQEKYRADIFPSASLKSLLDLVLPALLLLIIYYSVRFEITMYWDRLYAGSLHTLTEDNQDFASSYWNEDLKNFKAVWIINYSLLFFSMLVILKNKFLKQKSISFVILWLGIIVLFTFLIQGLYVLSELRDSYLNQTLSNIYPKTSFYISIRYVAFAFATIFLLLFARYVKSYVADPARDSMRTIFDLILYLTIIWVVTSEMITWMDIMHSEQSYKLVISILWGVYSLILIIMGIWKDKKYLRIAAIGLFAVTLIKLFFYDILQLSTLSKTIVFVVLGVLLLTISFLYNKYTHKIN
ncbi:MAG: DUF2339 domain-containing protein [Saprospiraceae bacterium]